MANEIRANIVRLRDYRTTVAATEASWSRQLQVMSEPLGAFLSIAKDFGPSSSAAPTNLRQFFGDVLEDSRGVDATASAFELADQMHIFGFVPTNAFIDAQRQAFLDGQPTDTPSAGSIAALNQREADLRAGGAAGTDPSLVAVQAQRDAAIRQLTGAPEPPAFDITVYDPAIAARAEADRVTYNAAVDAHNAQRLAAAGDWDHLIIPASHVRELPWEVPHVNDEVDRLMAEEDLGFAAAVTISMTQQRQPDFVPDGSTFLTLFEPPPLQGPWSASFASMVVDSGPELEAWAENLTADQQVSFTTGDDIITVTMRGDLVVISDGTTETIVDPTTTDRIFIAGNAGSDTITVDGDVTAHLVIAGGAGDDTIIGGGGNDIIVGNAGGDRVQGRGGHDIIVGGTRSSSADDLEGGDGNDLILAGAGSDYASGGHGNDIIWGGSGRDAVYGGSGNDLLIGQGGNDYLDGGKRDDIVLGGAGDDVTAGGRGDDHLDGGLGADVAIAGMGDDLVAGGTSADRAIVQTTDTVDSADVDITAVIIDASAGSSIQFQDNQRPEFISRVNDDLDTLRSTVTGNAMLTTLDAESSRTGNQVDIRELPNDQNNGFATAANGADTRHRFPAPPGPGSDSTVSYNPSFQLNNAGIAPPIVVLFHEFAHSYNHITGTAVDGTYSGTATKDSGINNRERQAVGLPIDHDEDGSATPGGTGGPPTPEIPVPGHPTELTENALREEFGMDPRPSYRR